MEQIQGLQIHAGDRVRITLPSGYSSEATVLTANNYGRRGGPDCWYIECRHVSDGLYGYWKQDPDGGVVELITMPVEDDIDHDLRHYYGYGPDAG